VATALASLMSLPAVALAPAATPIEEMSRLAAALGPASPRLFVKRDDLLSFGCGGNKVRKIQTVVAEARAAGADALITCGGVQSNHCRVTAAAGAALGMKVVLVVNGAPQAQPTANARLDRLFGAEVRHVGGRDERAPAMEQAAADLRAAGRRPFVVPLGASTAIGALGFARGVAEIAASGVTPDIIIHSSSSGGTQAGIIAGCALFGLGARVIGVSADESAASLAGIIRGLLDAMADKLGAKPSTIGAQRDIVVDDTQVGGGYGMPTPASTEALELAARREGMLLDPVYTAKAMAGLIAGIRAGSFAGGQTVLFWHTGGQVGYFA
jgi:1-aminocyclopropane-1-carboxylate deaminase/D-cysteine desulfhydrase-like pyridoxal-dependent ACC family enzyme